jgi:hypothetical protein
MCDLRSGDLVAINVFEGARRISKTIMLLIVVGSLIAIWFDSPDLTLKYEIDQFGDAPAKVDECSKDSALEVLNRYSADGDKVSVHLCFRAHLSEKAGEMRIPYALVEDDATLVWMGEQYSTPVMKYTKAAAQDFKLPADALKGTGFLLMKQRFSAGSKAVGYLCAGLLAFLLATSFIGWIVRGFLGIPNGMDARS